VAVAEFSIVPLGTGSTSLSPYVAACEIELREHGEGLKYELTAMGTINGGITALLKTGAYIMHEKISISSLVLPQAQI